MSVFKIVSFDVNLRLLSLIKKLYCRLLLHSNIASSFPFFLTRITFQLAIQCYVFLQAENPEIKGL